MIDFQYNCAVAEPQLVAIYISIYIYRANDDIRSCVQMRSHKQHYRHPTNKQHYNDFLDLELVGTSFFSAPIISRSFAEMAHSFNQGQRIELNFDTKDSKELPANVEGLQGTIRYIGEVHFTFGELVGIELDNPEANEKRGHGGTIDGIQEIETKRHKEPRI